MAYHTIMLMLPDISRLDSMTGEAQGWVLAEHNHTATIARCASACSKPEA